MQKILIFIFVIVIYPFSLYGQKRIYENDLVKFEYPNSFKSTPIKSSTNMILRLSSDECYISVSIKEKGLDSNIDIWDDRITDLLYQEYSEKGTIADITKEDLQLKGEKRHCLKVLINMPRRNQSSKAARVLIYAMLHKGNLFTFGFSSWGSYTKSSNTAYPDNIMKGVIFKDTYKSELDIEKHMIDIIKKMNAQCPIHVDQCTTHLLILLSGKTIMIKSLVEDACDEKVDYIQYKQKMCDNLSVLVDKPFIQYLDRNGYSLLYMIHNEHDKLKKKVAITPRDILKCYRQ